MTPAADKLIREAMNSMKDRLQEVNARINAQQALIQDARDDKQMLQDGIAELKALLGDPA